MLLPNIALIPGLTSEGPPANTPCDASPIKMVLTGSAFLLFFVGLISSKYLYPLTSLASLSDLDASGDGLLSACLSPLSYLLPPRTFDLPSSFLLGGAFVLSVGGVTVLVAGW